MIFFQFWLFFVFKLVVILLLVVQGSEKFLPMPPSWPCARDFLLDDAPWSSRLVEIDSDQIETLRKINIVP